MKLRSATGLRLLVLLCLLAIFTALILQRQIMPRVEAANGPDPVQIEILSNELANPWGMAFLPNGDILITERPGQLRLFSQGRLQADGINGLPDIVARGQGGLLDVALHPDFASNRWVYLSYAEPGDGGMGTAVGRGQLQGNALTNWQTLFRLQPKTGARQHFGSRLVFDNQGYLFITTGDRGDRHRSQDLDDHAGSVIRLHADGRIPNDNPYTGRANIRPEIYSYGHRNIQGAALHPATGKLWTHEHGPQGGDELNIIQPAANYGWPVVTHGKEYGTGFSIGEGTEKAGMVNPIHYWVPSIAPSGMVFYSGDVFPQWRDNLFIGALKFHLLVRLVLDGDRVVHEERLLENRLGRIRDVRQGPDGLLYLLTDDNPGILARLSPLPEDK